MQHRQSVPAARTAESQRDKESQPLPADPALSGSDSDSEVDMPVTPGSSDEEAHLNEQAARLEAIAQEEVTNEHAEEEDSDSDSDSD